MQVLQISVLSVAHRSHSAVVSCYRVHGPRSTGRGYVQHPVRIGKQVVHGIVRKRLGVCRVAHILLDRRTIESHEPPVGAYPKRTLWVLRKALDVGSVQFRNQ